MYTIIEVPFHLGLEGISVGKGPASLIRAGVDNILGRGEMPALVTHIRIRDLRSKGMDAIMDVNRVLHYAIKEAVNQETIPVVFSGNCNAAIGTLAGLDTERLGIVWLDKHPDFHTPQTSRSGNIEGMTLSIITGDCHQEWRERTGMLQPVTTQNVILAGFWDVEPGEKERLQDSWISAHPSDSLALLPVALDRLKDRVDAVYLHIDTDFLEGNEDPARLIALVRESIPLAAVGVSNYNPDLDPSKILEKEILRALTALKKSKGQA